jgi:HAMP domain-containing protein
MTVETLKLRLRGLPWRDLAARLRRDLGLTGAAALALILAAALFGKVVLEPAQSRAHRLADEVARRAPDAAPERARGTAADKVETLYGYLAREESTTDWLAKLYGIGKATGVELPSASYRPQAPAGAASSRIERYEIVLPVTATYASLRAFLARALAEMPILSLDQITIKRESRNDGAVQAELRFTLHLVKS